MNTEIEIIKRRIKKIIDYRSFQNRELIVGIDGCSPEVDYVR